MRDTIKDVWRKASRRLGGREPLVLISFLVALGGAWGFIEIADEVSEGETQAIDEWVVKAMRRPDNPAEPIGPPWLEETGRDVTALGGVFWLVFFTLAVAGYLWFDQKRRLMLFLLASTFGGLLLSQGLKMAFARPRPTVVPHLAEVYTSSFPSGHSMLSAVVYLTLGSLLTTAVPRRRLKAYVLGLALLMTALIGVSRIYLGVHYPTDVLAGWTAGLVWALLCWLAARWLQRHGEVEAAPPVEEPQNAEAPA
jgi:undecaprenyl-diphosphatase